MHKRRDHLIEFLYHNYNTIKNKMLPYLTFAIVFMGRSQKGLMITAFVLMCAAVVIYSFFAWFNKTYEFQKGLIVYSSGVFKKKRNDIPLVNIKSINTHDSLIKRMFGIANLKIELIGGEEIIFVLHKEEIENLRNTFFKNNTEQQQSTTVAAKQYKLNLFQYWLMSMTNIPLILAAWSVTLTVGSFAIDHFGVSLGLETQEQHQRSEEDTRSLWSQLTDDWSGKEIDLGIVLELSLFLVALLVVSMTFTYIIALLTYRNFKIHETGKEIEISFGYINKRHYVIPKKEVRSLRIVEPLILRLFGYVQVKVDTIGLDSNAGSVLFIAPIIKKEQVAPLIKDYLPQFAVKDIEMRPDKGVLWNYLFTSTFTYFLFASVVSLAWTKLIFVMGLIPLFLLMGFVKWKSAGLTFDDGHIVHSYTKGFTIHTVTTLKTFVETTTVVDPFFARRRGLVNYRFSLYSERVNEIYECKLIPNKKTRLFLNYPR